MWYGNITAKAAAEAERIARNIEHERRQKRIAKWIAEAAIKRAKEQAKFRAAVAGEYGVANRSSL